LEAKSISEEANFPFGIVLSNSSLGHNYNEQGEFEKALVLSKSALSAFQQGGFSLNLAGAFSIVANSYKGLKDYTKAAYNYEQAIRVYREIENTSYLKYNYTWLAYSYRMLGKSEDAFSNYGLALNYADTLFNQERTQAIEELKAKYETEKLIQDKEIADAESLVALEKAKRSKFVSYGAIFFAAIVSLLVALILNRLKLIRRQKRKLDDAYAQLEESKKNELAVSNLKALQSQMNPHFIFNALNSVQDLVLLQDIRSSNKYLGKFSDLIRKILLSSKAQFITLAEEVEILNLYLDLEKLRFGDDFEIDLKCDVPEDKQEDIDLPAMFIQPYLENAIKHGLFHKAGLKKLKVHFKLIGANTLECMVEDNGIGQEQAAIYKQKRLHLHTGFSTEAINERIRLLNETLVNKIELTIEDLFYHNQASGTRIILRFPVQELK
jgi:tetratricopeptide (TPR) repeat protein